MAKRNKKNGFSDKQRLYIGVVAGILFGLALSLVIGSYGNFTASLDDEETASLKLKNPSFESTGNWIFQSDSDIQYTYSMYTSNGWPRDGARSFRMNIPSGSSSNGEVRQVFRMPEEASQITVDWHGKGTYVHGSGGAYLVICDVSQVKPYIATEPVITTGLQYCVNKRGNPTLGNPATLALNVPESYKGKIVYVALIQDVGTTGTYDIYWDNVRILDAQGRVI